MQTHSSAFISPTDYNREYNLNVSNAKLFNMFRWEIGLRLNDTEIEKTYVKRVLGEIKGDIIQSLVHVWFKVPFSIPIAYIQAVMLDKGNVTTEKIRDNSVTFDKSRQEYSSITTYSSW